MSNKKYKKDFWDNVEKTDSCWLWTGCQQYTGYGMFWTGFKLKYAHRCAWELINGPIAKGLYICHTCDRPRCVNPNHLFLGTAGKNSKDSHQKGRRIDLRINKEASLKYKTNRLDLLKNQHKLWKETNTA